MILRPLPSDVPQLVPLEQMKAHLRVDHVFEDDLINAYAGAAAGWISTVCGRLYELRSYEAIARSFGELAALPRGIKDVSSFRYLDTSGAEQPFGGYRVIGEEYLELTGALPPVADRGDAVMLQFTGGTEHPPAEIVQAHLLLTGHMFCHRKPLDVVMGEREVPFSIRALVMPHRSVRALV